MAAVLGRVFSRGRKAQAGEEDEPKKYKKANLGQANQMYYNEELQMWVEKGKEEEARAEKAKLSAPPPPSVGSMSAASSATSLATMSDAAGPPAPNFSRSKGLASRYVQTPTLATGGAAGSTPGSSPALPAPKALLPGMGGPKLPGIPGPPGTGPPSFFRPTPAASEATSDAMGGSDMGSVSGLSGLDAFFPNSRNASQPNFFMPGPAPSSSTNAATDDTQGAGRAADSAQQQAQEGGARTSSGSGGAAGQHPRQSSEGAAPSFRESDASVSGRPPALSGPSNVSFASWQHLRESGSGSNPVSTHGAAGQGASSGAGAEREASLGQQGSSSPDTEADAQAEVSSPAPGLYPSKQQHQQHEQQQQQWSVPESNGSAAAAAAYGNGFYVPAGADGPLANGNLSAAADGEQAGWQEEQQQPPLATELSAGWDSRPVKDPFDSDAGAVSSAAATAGASAWEAAEGGQGWEGGDWQSQQHQQQQHAYATQAQQDAAGAGYAPAGAGGAWGAQQAGTGWGWQGDWGAGGADPEGGSPAAAAGDGGAAWQQQPEQQAQAPADAQQHAAYYGGYGEQYAAADGAATAGGYSYQQQQEGAAYGGYPPAAAAAGGADTMQPAVEVLEPVHPQLPGLSIAGQGSDGIVSPTYAPPGTGSSGSRGSKGLMRHTSMPGSPLAHQTSMGALLPQPPRHSVGGLLPGQHSLGPDGQAEAAAVILSTPAAAGDASMLTAVRPSSPYARAVSPLSRTSTTVGDAAVCKQSSGGFPIPSPPSHGGLLNSRAPSCSMFIPGNSSGAAGAAGTAAPWQPGAVAAGAAGWDTTKSQQQGHAGLMNGYDPAAYGQWQQQEGQAYGGYQQQQGAGGVPAVPGTSAPPVPTFSPGLLESLPRDAPPSWQRDGAQQPSAPASASAAAATSGGRQDTLQASVAARAHPYDQFISQALSQVNWRAVHFKQPGKLNRMLPWEEFEMERALQEEAEAQASGHQERKSPFWYRQMEFRQKLPPASMKPSASEPAAMPSRAAKQQGAPPGSAAESAGSQVSAYPGWPQLQEQQHQQHLMQQQQDAYAYQQQQQQVVPGSPLTPARAATTGALGAVAAGGLQQQPEEPTPTSKLTLPAEAAAEAAGGEAGAAVPAAEQAEGQQQAWAGWRGYGDQQQQQQAATADWQQQDPQYAQYYAQQYDQQQYAQEQYGQTGEYGQQSYAGEQQQQYGAYDPAQWQQRQQQYGDAEGGAASEQSAAVAVGWSAEVDTHRGATWGSPDAEMLDGSGAAQGAQLAGEHHHQQQQQEQQQDFSAAAADDAAGAWGADEALDLQLGIVSDDTAAAAAAAGHELHAPDVVAAALAARISSSSIGLESQPSTGRAAAAAAKQLVSNALANIMQQHTVPEDAEQEEGEAAAAGGGWEDEEAAWAGWEGGEEGAGAQEQAASAGGDAGEGYSAAAVSPAWSKLAQQFTAAAQAAAATGQLDSGLAEYQQYFMQYGDYLLGALPQEALQQAGLLAELPGAAAEAGDSHHQQQQQQQALDEEQEELYAEFGNLQLRDDTSAGLFASLGFDIDSLMACCAEA